VVLNKKYHQDEYVEQQRCAAVATLHATLRVVCTAILDLQARQKIAQDLVFACTVVFVIW